MAKLNICGKVLYKNLTPVENARVRIYDLDAGGDGNDKILERNSSLEGMFHGKSADWKDKNTVNVPFIGKVNVPDIMALKFYVNVDGKRHSGPFFHFGDNRSAPIVLPWGPVKIKRKQRDLLVFTTLSKNPTGFEKFIYEMIEGGSEVLATSILGRKYRKIHVVKGKNATREALKKNLERIARNRNIKAVDMILAVHGSLNKLSFYDGSVNDDDIEQDLRAIPSACRKKFRALFSTACYGESHMRNFVRGGFKVVDGSRDIYADSLVSYPVLLGTWASGGSFKAAVRAANSSDPLDIQDKTVQLKYSEKVVDSYREIAGDGRLRIYSPI